MQNRKLTEQLRVKFILEPARALTPAPLQAYGRRLGRINIALRPFGQFLRSRPSDARCLLRQHAEPIQIAETKHLRLRRLERARLALLHVDDTTASKAAVTHCYGFSDLRHFVAAYRNAFGVLPRIEQPARCCYELALTFSAPISGFA
jgi:AraC-like DNA-binding protein